MSQELGTEQVGARVDETDQDRHKRLLEELLEQKRVATENSFQLGRRAFITSLVAIMLNPISAAIGYYMNHILQKPDLEIVYTNTRYTVDNHVFDDTALVNLKKRIGLIAKIREIIQKLTITRTDFWCTAWLDGETWYDECASAVEQAIRGLRNVSEAQVAAISKNLEGLENSQSSQPLSWHTIDDPRLDMLSALAGGQNKNQIMGLLKGQRDILNDEIIGLNELSVAMAKMRTESETPRTGVVDFTVGILNRGEADGVVLNRGTLKFSDGELWIHTTPYTVVKSHSFQEIVFEIGMDTENSEILQAWIDKVKNKLTHKAEIVLKSDKKTISYALTLD